MKKKIVMEEKRGRGRPKGKKTRTLSRAEQQQLRVDSIDKIFKEHLNHSQFVRWCGTDYGLSKHRCNVYWTSSWKTVEEKFKLEKDKLVTKHIQAYWDLYKQSHEKGDFNTARQVLNDLARMGGLNEPDALDINHQGEITFRFGDETED
jgi:hypothetical protein